MTKTMMKTITDGGASEQVEGVQEEEASASQSDFS